MHLQTLLFAPLATLLQTAPAPPAQNERASGPAEVPVGTLELTYLANEGFLLRTSAHAVLIDAFVAEPYSGYAGLSARAREALLTGTAPFQSLDLALTSHAHPDHFQADFACAVLAAHPKLPLVSTPDVVSKLLEGCPELEPRVTALWPEKESTLTSEHAGVRLELLQLSHGTGRFRDVQNLGHTIELDGVRILHLGDADMSPKNFAPYAFGERRFDVALVPYWYARHPSGKRFLGELRTRHLVFVHVPPDEVEVTRRDTARDFPDASVFGECLERRSFDCRPAQARGTSPETGGTKENGKD